MASELNECFGFALFPFVIGYLIRAKLSTNEKQSQNQSCLARTRFPALGAGYTYFIQILIGSLYLLQAFLHLF